MSKKYVLNLQGKTLPEIIGPELYNSTLSLILDARARVIADPLGTTAMRTKKVVAFSDLMPAQKEVAFEQAEAILISRLWKTLIINTPSDQKLLIKNEIQSVHRVVGTFAPTFIDGVRQDPKMGADDLSAIKARSDMEPYDTYYEGDTINSTTDRNGEYRTYVP